MPIFATGDVIAQPSKTFSVGRSDQYVDVYRLLDPNVENRMFIGIHIFNPSAAQTVQIVGVPDGISPVKPDISCPPLTFLTFDLMTFGIGARDMTKGERIDFIKAKTTNPVGTFSSATIDYSVSAQPATGERINVAGYIFEFADDLSKDPSSDFIVTIGATADDSWNNMASVINSSINEVRASNNPGIDLLTIEANYPGLMGSDIVVADGATPTGATFSGNTGTVAVGAGGVEPTIHIW
jgi:hypothetical protein